MERTSRRELSRRSLIGGGVALSSVLLVGCGPAETQKETRRASAIDPGRLADTALTMTVFRDPNCGCCESWATAARQAGFDATLVNSDDMSDVKRRLGVPEALASCHTTSVGGYAIEGHVPLADVKRLLAERPAGIKGIAVPGMPAGSPGMEMPDGIKEPYQVLAFDASGATRVFSQQG